MKTLTNGIITIGVNDHGAELCSLMCKGREYLWGAYPEYWKRHSPVLFPIVGSLWNGEFRSKGKTYKMSQHGFARDMDFTLLSVSDDEIWYELRSTDETLQKYPYEFILRIGYKLHGSSVDVCWEVENPSDEEIAFQIGAHPAFYWPLLSNEVISQGVEAMEKVLAEDRQRGFFSFNLMNRKLADFVSPAFPFVHSQTIKEQGCVSEADICAYDVRNGALRIFPKLFDRDALILDERQTDIVTLLDIDRKPYLSVAFSAPVVGLWSPPHKNAPFVCIEPWYGRADEVGYNGTFEERKHMNHLAPHSTFKAKYEITIH